MTEHTPTPWLIQQYENSVIAYVENRNDQMQILHTSWYGLICARYPLKSESLANMRFAVEAVNNHEALKARVKELEEGLQCIERLCADASINNDFIRGNISSTVKYALKNNGEK